MTKFSTFVHGSVRHLALALTLAGIPASVLAVDDTLVVTYKDNHTFSYVLADRPTVTFDATQMFIKSDIIDDSHALADVKTFTFSDVSAISEISADERRIVFTDASTVTLQGFTAGTKISVSDIAGRFVLTTVVANDGTATLNISQLIAGVYVVATTDGKSYKISKR